MVFEANIFDHVQPKKIGEFELIDKIITKKDIGFMSPFYEGQRITVLKHKGQTVMSNTDMEKRTNSDFVRKAYGDILVGGLGIGMIILEVQDKEDVDTITIVEKNAEVIELLADVPFNEKVKIIQDDIFTWKPRERRFDVIYLDIWSYIDSDVYQEMKRLKNKYQRYLKPKSTHPKRWLACWAEYHAKNKVRLW